MSEDILFSIIIPIYNCEQYIKKAITSILEQSYKNFELILVDDCSTDHSYTLCEDLATQDKRIKLLKNLNNSGVSVSRNRGIECINGEYVTFVDADDFIESDYLERIYSVLNKEEYDCIKVGCIEEYYNNSNEIISVQQYIYDSGVIKSQQQVMSTILKMEQIPLFGYLWNGVYKVDIIRKFKLSLNENYRINEDFEFNIRFFKHVKNFISIPYCGYHYARRVNNSLSTRVQPDYYELHYKKIELFWNILSDKNCLTQVNREILFWLYTRIIYSAIERCRDRENFKLLYYQIRNEKLYSYFRKTSFEYSNIKRKILIYLIKYENPYFIYFASRFIGYIKKKFPVIFSRIKR